MTSSAASLLSPGGQCTSTTRCGSTVTGTGVGATSENFTPPRSMRVDGPGASLSWIVSMNTAAMIRMTPTTLPGEVSGDPGALDAELGIERHEIGAGADLDPAAIGQPEQVRRRGRRRADGVAQWH